MIPALDDSGQSIGLGAKRIGAAYVWAVTGIHIAIFTLLFDGLSRSLQVSCQRNRPFEQYLN